MKIDITKCAEFQDLYPAGYGTKVVSVTVSGGSLVFLYRSGILIKCSLRDIEEGVHGLRRQHEVAILKAHFPEAFI